MQKRKMSISGKNVVVLIAGILLVGTLAAQCAFADDEATKSDGRDVEITYLNDAEPDEIVAMEDTSLEGVFAADWNNIPITTATINGVEDQAWTGNPVTLPNLEVTSIYMKDGVHPYKITYPEPYYITVEYENNINPGTAKVIITGVGLGWDMHGGLSGSITIPFQIIKEGSETEPDTEPKNPIDLPKGTTATVGTGTAKAVYSVTGNNTVTFKKSKAGKNATSAKVPETVIIIGQTYKVTAIAKKAFYGMGKLKKVTIGSNVVSIGASAFGKCRKLKTLVVKSTILKASKCKKCLTGSSIKTVKVPAAVKKTYKKKIFVKKICGLKVTVK